MLGLAMFRGPKVLTLHNASFPDAPWRHRIAPYYRWVFRRAAAVIAVSEATAQSMGRYAKFQSTIIPNGIDGAYWRADPSSRYLRPGTRNLVYLGRLEERNGPEVAIASFAKIAQSMPDVRLLMAGDGPMRPALEAQVPAAAPPARRISGRGLRSTPGAARLVVVVPAARAGGGILHHGAGGLCGGPAGRGAPGAGRRSGRRALGERGHGQGEQQRGLRRRRASKRFSRTRAIASRAGEPSPTPSTGSGWGAGSSTSSSASPGLPPTARACSRESRPNLERA